MSHIIYIPLEHEPIDWSIVDKGREGVREPRQGSSAIHVIMCLQILSTCPVCSMFLGQLEPPLNSPLNSPITQRISQTQPTCDTYLQTVHALPTNPVVVVGVVVLTSITLPFSVQHLVVPVQLTPPCTILNPPPSAQLQKTHTQAKLGRSAAPEEPLPAAEEPRAAVRHGKRSVRQARAGFVRAYRHQQRSPGPAAAQDSGEVLGQERRARRRCRCRR